MLQPLFSSSYSMRGWSLQQGIKERPAKGGARLSLADSNGFYLPLCKGSYLY